MAASSATPYILFIGSVLLSSIVKRSRSLKKYKMVALDLDGTTLNSAHELSERTKATIRRLNEKGVHICIATGRSTPSVISFITKLELVQDTVPCVCFNGGCGVEISRYGTVVSQIFDSPLSPESAKILLRFAEAIGVCAQYYIGSTGDVYAVPTTAEHNELLQRYATLTGKQQIRVTSYSEAEAIEAPAKILLMTNDADRLLEAVRTSLPPTMFHVIRGSPSPFFVEFLTPGVSKGYGLMRMCEARGVALGDVVAFGDGDNDDEFLRAAGRGVAMRNAQSLAKAAADEVIPVWCCVGDNLQVMLLCDVWLCLDVVVGCARACDPRQMHN